MKKLLTALLCLALLAQLAFPVWAEDDLEIVLEQEPLAQDAQEINLEDNELAIEEADTSIVNGLDEIVLDDVLDTDIELTDLDGEILLGENGEVAEENEYASNAADDFEIINGVLVEYRGNGGAVTIPDGVTAIADEAFKDCDGLGSVKIPSSVTTIGTEAFYSCDNLSKVQILGTVISMGEGAFSKCYSLNSINLPVGLTSIEDYTFYTCRNLESITIPEGVT